MFLRSNSRTSAPTNNVNCFLLVRRSCQFLQFCNAVLKSVVIVYIQCSECNVAQIINQMLSFCTIGRSQHLIMFLLQGFRNRKELPHCQREWD